jgi:ubiquinone biosynthesis protein
MEAPQWSKTLPQLPRLIHHLLAERHELPGVAGNDELMRTILVEQKRTNRLLQALLIFGLAVGAGAVITQVWLSYAYGG